MSLHSLTRAHRIVAGAGERAWLWCDSGRGTWYDEGRRRKEEEREQEFFHRGREPEVTIVVVLFL